MRNINLLIITFLSGLFIFTGCFLFKNRIPVEDVTQSDCEPISTDKQELEEIFEFIINDNNLIINHYNAMRHCGYDIKFIAELHEDNLIVREIDLSKYQAGCTCYLDFSVKIPDLDKGLYHVELWKEEEEILAQKDIIIN